MISKEALQEATNRYFYGKERIIASRKDFLKDYTYSISTIIKQYGSFESFCQEENIVVLKSKKGKYSKEEVDNAIKAWIKAGKEIPRYSELSQCGLPSGPVIAKYYQTWHEPFDLYLQMNKALN